MLIPFYRRLNNKEILKCIKQGRVFDKYNKKVKGTISNTFDPMLLPSILSL